MFCPLPKAGRFPSQVTGLSLSKAVLSKLPALQATWTIPQSDEPIYWYILQYRKLGDTSWGHEVTIPGSIVNSTKLARLGPGTEYTVRVRAVSAVGAGMWSAVQTERTYKSEFLSMIQTISVSVWQPSSAIRCNNILQLCRL